MGSHWIGTASNIVAEYKDGSWRNAGTMLLGRYDHSAITLGSTVIIFGYPDQTKMELFDLNTLESELVDITDSPANTFSKFLVPNGFCSAN